MMLLTKREEINRINIIFLTKTIQNLRRNAENADLKANLTRIAFDTSWLLDGLSFSAKLDLLLGANHSLSIYLE